MENSVDVLKTLKIEQHDPAILLLVFIWEKIKSENTNSKRLVHTHVNCSLIYNSQNKEET